MLVALFMVGACSTAGNGTGIGNVVPETTPNTDVEGDVVPETTPNADVEGNVVPDADGGDTEAEITLLPMIIASTNDYEWNSANASEDKHHIDKATVVLSGGTTYIAKYTNEHTIIFRNTDYYYYWDVKVDYETLTVVNSNWVELEQKDGIYFEHQFDEPTID